MRTNALRLSLVVNVILLVLLAFVEWPTIVNYLQRSSDRELCRIATDALARYQATHNNELGMVLIEGDAEPPYVASRTESVATVIVPRDPSLASVTPAMVTLQKFGNTWMTVTFSSGDKDLSMPNEYISN